MYQPKGKISGKTFKKMLAGSHSFVPAEVAKSLKSAGLGGLLSKSHVSREEAVKALKHLQEEKKIASKAPSEIWQRASIDEQEAEEIAAEEQKKLNIRITQLRNISDTLAAEEAEREEEVTGYDPKKYFGRVIDEMDLEREKREKKIAAARLSREEMLKAGSKIAAVKPPKLAEPPDIFSGL